MSSASQIEKDEAKYSPFAGITDEERQLIEGSLPNQFLALPRKARKLLIFDLALEFKHSGIPYANLAFTLMGEKTGAFTAVVENDPAVFAADSLKQFDAILFNDTTGNLFEDPQLRQNLLAFVEGGGGLMGLHAAISAFVEKGQDKWPEFGAMLGARGAGHNLEGWGDDTPGHQKMNGTPGTCYKINREFYILKAEDPAHPVSRMFDGQRYPMRADWSDEILFFGAPFTRDNVRVLISVDTDTSMLWNNEPFTDAQPGQFPVVWVKSHGKGRVLYCNFGHNEDVFWHEKLMNFFLASAQFVLGDLVGDTTPNPPMPVVTPMEENKQSQKPLPFPACPSWRDICDDEFRLIERALPKLAPAKPAKPRKLLIFDDSIDPTKRYHPSIPQINLVFTRMGEKTGAYSTVVAHDPEVFTNGSLDEFDAILYNNNTSVSYRNEMMEKNVTEFVTRGGGFMALHAAIISFAGWKEFTDMIGASGAYHRICMEKAVLTNEEPNHPISKSLVDSQLTLREEFFRHNENNIRESNRILLSIDASKTNMNQGHNFGNCMRDDYPVAWIHDYGKGRCFYANFSHNPQMFMYTSWLKFFLAATQFALGDLPCPTAPRALMK
jgi:type 1 glutamine amidotransferase